MPNEFTHRFTQALNEAISQALPSTPSGSHKMLVVGQLVVNLQNEADPPAPCRFIREGASCCGRCHK